MRRKWLHFVSGSLLVLGASFLIGYRAQSQSNEALLRGFVAHQREEYHPRNAGLPPKVTHRTVAVRSDGSRAETYSVTTPAGMIEHVRSISDLRKRTWTKTEPSTKSLATFHLTDSEIRDRRHSQNLCSSSEISLAKKSASEVATRAVMLGFGVIPVKVRESRHSVSRWVAPELNCYALRETAVSEHGSRTEFQVEKLEIGDPPDAMFEGPPDYVERSPAEIEALYLAKYPGHPLFGRSLETIQQHYFAHQKKK